MKTIVQTFCAQFFLGFSLPIFFHGTLQLDANSIQLETSRILDPFNDTLILLSRLEQNSKVEKTFCETYFRETHLSVSVKTTARCVNRTVRSNEVNVNFGIS